MSTLKSTTVDCYSKIIVYKCTIRLMWSLSLFIQTSLCIFVPANFLSDVFELTLSKFS